MYFVDKYCNIASLLVGSIAYYRIVLTIYNKTTCICADMFSGAATDSSTHIIIGYTTDTETIATNMKNTCTNETAKARIELKKID